MAEVAPAGGGGINRNFLFIVGGLAALLVIGLLGAGALFLLPALFPSKPAVVGTTVTPTRVVIAAATATQPPAPTATLVVAQAATDTPVPTATGSGGFVTATPTVAPVTPTVTVTPTSGESLPSSGLGEDLLWLVGGLVLVVVIFAARRMRMSS